jgi:hypothetical protein
VTIKYYDNIIQRSEEWYAARCGLLTASEMKNIITPAKLEYAKNDKEKTHLYELLAQRVNKYVEPAFLGFDMLRGQEDESYARVTYIENYSQVKDCGFITNDKWGFTLGYSPDGLVGEHGVIETKSRSQKFQMETILADAMPDEYKIQVQTGLLVSERKWCDFISYCGGMMMMVKRVEADPVIQEAIVKAATIFHGKLDDMLKLYAQRVDDPGMRLVMTERVEREIHL